MINSSYQDSWHYQDLEIEEDHLPPQNPSLSGDEISCDEHATKNVHLFKYFVADQEFRDTELTGNIAGGRVTFAGLPNGYYVLGYTGNEFCTVVMQVNQ